MRVRPKTRFLLVSLLPIAVSGLLIISFHLFWKKSLPEFSSASEKSVTVTDGRLEFVFRSVSAKTVSELLSEKNLALQDGDSVFPEPEASLVSGSRVIISRAHTFTLKIDGKEENITTQAESVEEALKEAKISLDEDDIVSPSREAFVSDGLLAKVTRVEVTEETVEKSVAFSEKVSEDDELSWRKKVVTQKGEKGTDLLTYRVSKHDGKEINRKLLKTERTKEPVEQIVTQGTYVKTGKSHSGGASWYAHTGTLAAANPWLPMGSYVKVTNTENGKSVIVVINDRGPFGPGRIIDLDKVAFQKIASLGQGVVNVKMEEIVN